MKLLYILGLSTLPLWWENKTGDTRPPTTRSEMNSKPTESNLIASGWATQLIGRIALGSCPTEGLSPTLKTADIKPASSRNKNSLQT